jgi:hypothetical protein
MSREKHALESIPALFLERVNLNSKKVRDGNSS